MSRIVRELGKGTGIETKIEIILQANGRYIEKSTRYTFLFMFEWFQNKTQEFTSLKYHFERNFVYISIFKNGPKYAPMEVRFIFNFLCASFQVIGYEALKIQSQISIKAF